MQKIFVKTTNNEFEEVYLKAIKISATNFNITLCELITDKVFNYYNQFYYTSIEKIMGSHDNLAICLLGDTRVDDFIEQHIGARFLIAHNYGDYNDLFLKLYRWTGNEVVAWHTPKIWNIGGFKYDFETNKMTIIKSGAKDSDGLGEKIVNALTNGDKTIEFNGITYYFNENECRNANKIVIHRLDEKVDEKNKLKEDIISKLNYVIKETSTEIDYIRRGERMTDEDGDALQVVVDTLLYVKTKLKK